MEAAYSYTALAAIYRSTWKYTRCSYPGFNNAWLAWALNLRCWRCSKLSNYCCNYNNYLIYCIVRSIVHTKITYNHSCLTSYSNNFHDDIRLQELQRRFNHANHYVANDDVKRLYIHDLYYELLPLATYIVPRAWPFPIFFVAVPPRRKTQKAV